MWRTITRIMLESGAHRGAVAASFSRHDNIIVVIAADSPNWFLRAKAEEVKIRKVV